MDKINGICVNILSITDEEIEEMRETIKEQRSYMNPLKMATTGYFHDLADHNDEVLNSILKLKSVIADGSDIVRP